MLILNDLSLLAIYGLKLCGKGCTLESQKLKTYETWKRSLHSNSALLSSIFEGNISHHSNIIYWLNDIFLAKFWTVKIHKGCPGRDGRRSRILSLRNTQEMCLVVSTAAFTWRACHFLGHCLLGPHLGQISTSERAIPLSLVPCLAGPSAAVAPSPAQPHSTA